MTTDRSSGFRAVGQLPNGYTLYCYENEVGGRTYMTDECDGVIIWDTAITDSHTLLAAIVHDESMRRKEFHEKKNVSH